MAWSDNQTELYDRLSEQSTDRSPTCGCRHPARHTDPSIWGRGLHSYIRARTRKHHLQQARRVQWTLVLRQAPMPREGAHQDRSANSMGHGGSHDLSQRASALQRTTRFRRPSGHLAFVLLFSLRASPRLFSFSAICDSLSRALQHQGECMRRVCSWCNRDLPGSKRGSREITHGICQRCLYHEAQKHPAYACAYTKQYGDTVPPKRVACRFKRPKKSLIRITLDLRDPLTKSLAIRTSQPTLARAA